MARKSNKTDHVLSLLAGHESKNEETEVKDPQEALPKTPVAPQSVSVIDTTESDPVADLIQQNLTAEFEKEIAEAAPEPKPEPEPVQAQAEAVPEPQPEPQPEPEPVQVEQTPEPQPEPEPEPVQAEATPAPQPEPEPDFVILNVMEEIVKEKIIYFMRQFDVCTCDRCIADTIALTLNGLTPKYIVTMPAAVAPLLSLYTNRYIADVTVEATKACMIVRENPRH